MAGYGFYEVPPYCKAPTFEMVILTPGVFNIMHVSKSARIVKCFKRGERRCVTSNQYLSGEARRVDTGSDLAHTYLLANQISWTMYLSIELTD